MEAINQGYINSVQKLFRYYESLGRKAIDQLEDAQMNQSIDSGSNSIFIIVKHIHGNMLSRWTNFLTEDGEKTWRNREGEFEGRLETKAEVLALWEAGWDCFFNAVDPLEGADMSKIIYIRNEGHTVQEAINRQLGHYAYHVGQIVYLAKQLRGEAFASLSIPKGGSADFNKKKFDQDKKRKHFV